MWRSVWNDAAGLTFETRQASARALLMRLAPNGAVAVEQDFGGTSARGDLVEEFEALAGQFDMAHLAGLGRADQQRSAIAVEIGDMHPGKLAVPGAAQ